MQLINAILAAVAFTAVMAQPLEQAGRNCSSICTSYSTTMTKTKTLQDKRSAHCEIDSEPQADSSSNSTITTTVTSFGATQTAFVTSTVSLTSPSCPSSSAIVGRQVVDAACACKSMDVTTTVTKQVTKTRTSTVKTPTTVTSTILHTATPSSFYMQSSYDGGFASLQDEGSYYELGFAPCSANCALFTLNGTDLVGPDGSVANNEQCCGAAGLPVAFSAIDQGFSALTCKVAAGLLSCGVESATAFEVCGGSLLLGGSHLCEATEITVVEPVFF